MVSHVKPIISQVDVTNSAYKIFLVEYRIIHNSLFCIYSGNFTDILWRINSYNFKKSYKDNKW